MLQQLAQDTGAQSWAVASMLFFLAVYAIVAIGVFRTPKAEHRAHAHLPLEDGEVDAHDDSAAPR